MIPDGRSGRLSSRLPASVVLVVVLFVCLELQTAAASAQQRAPASGRRQSAAGRPLSSEEIDALAESAAAGSDGGSIQISHKKTKSSLRTSYRDETDTNVGRDQLVHENMKIYIESENEESKSTRGGLDVVGVPLNLFGRSSAASTTASASACLKR